MATSSFAPQAYTGPARTRDGKRRVCFQMQFDTSDLPQYLKDHEAVWPEMQQALVECGWHNYSLFYRADGFAIGYFETDESFDVACRRMDLTAVNAAWQAAMAKYTPSGLTPLAHVAELTPYFYLGADREGAAPPTRSKSHLVLVAAATFGLGAMLGFALGRRS